MVSENEFYKLRKRMVKEQIWARGIREKKILKAFLRLPREIFVPERYKEQAYGDFPLSIGEGQTISQPYMVALMTSLLKVNKNEKVLEIGTGSGYQAAILSELGARVYSIERIPSLAQKAKKTLLSLGYKVEIKIGDGSLGWPQESPYNKIIVTAAVKDISPYWKRQLTLRGKIVLPRGSRYEQTIVVADKVSEDDFRETQLCKCIFVPLIGKYGFEQ